MVRRTSRTYEISCEDSIICSQYHTTTILVLTCWYVTNAVTFVLAGSINTRRKVVFTPLQGNIRSIVP